MIKRGETRIWGSFSGPNLYLSYMDYVDAVRVQIDLNSRKLRLPGPKPGMARSKGAASKPPR